MKATVLIIVLIVGVMLLAGSVYTVGEGQQAVVTEFGKPVGAQVDAGLKFKLPFIQTVTYLEKRLLPWDGEAENMQTRDKKRIYIDVWARWRISNPMQFFQRLRTEQRGYGVLDNLIDSAVRDVVARRDLIEAVRSTNRELLYESEELSSDAAAERDVITVGRARMEAEIFEVASEELAAGQYGMELMDVHIKRVNYIETVRSTVYERMKSERMRIARLYESEAEEERNRILGLMQKELDEIEGEMQQRSAEIRGAADAEVIKIAAEAYSQSPEFYAFLKQLALYKAALGERTRLIVSTDNALFGALLNPGGDCSSDGSQ